MKSYVKSKMLTHDREQAARYDSDPLIFRQIAVNVLLDLHDTSKRLLADAGAIQTPTLMIGAGKDWVVSLKAQQKFFDRAFFDVTSASRFSRTLITRSFTKRIVATSSDLSASSFEIASRKRQSRLHW